MAMRSGASAASRGRAAAMLQAAVMSEQVAVEEVTQARHQQLVLVFEHVVAGVFVDLLLGARQRVLEALQEMVIKKLLDADHQTIPMVMINGETSPLKAWLDDVLTQTHQRPVYMPDAFSNTAHGEQNHTIYAMIVEKIPKPPKHLDPNDIIDVYLNDSDFHFLKSLHSNNEIG
jgi:hypothetical protein